MSVIFHVFRPFREIYEAYTNQFNSFLSNYSTEELQTVKDFYSKQVSSTALLKAALSQPITQWVVVHICTSITTEWYDPLPSVDPLPSGKPVPSVEP
jgi:hypothetical protein